MNDTVSARTFDRRLKNGTSSYSVGSYPGGGIGYMPGGGASLGINIVALVEKQCEDIF